MARLPRLSVAGVPHLLVQRGLEGQSVFRDRPDRDLFRRLFGEIARAETVAIHAYALADGEVRALLTPSDADALGRLMQMLGRRYGSAFNRRHGRRGSLWEGRFRATPIEPERYLLPATLWVEEAGPSAAEILSDGDHALTSSSLAHHLGAWRDPLVTDHAVFWTLGNTPFERDIAHRGRTASGLTLSERHKLESAVQKGWPLGGVTFIRTLANLTERRLVPLPRGRPPAPPRQAVDTVPTAPQGEDDLSPI